MQEQQSVSWTRCYHSGRMEQCWVGQVHGKGKGGTSYHGLVFFDLLF